MKYKIERVTSKTESDLVAYSAAHGAEHDSSYLPGRDFELSDEYPSYLLKGDGQIVGAVSLMRIKRFLSINTARFSILHSVLNTQDAYTRMLDAIQSHFQDLESVYLFIPEERESSASFLTKLGFEIERYSFILERASGQNTKAVFPDGFTVQHLDANDQEGIRQFADCINAEFKELAGHTPSTPEDVQTWFDDSSYVEGGYCLLKNGQEPVGTICMMKDLDNLAAGEIGGFGILKEYRGQELGRNLLRFGMQFLADQGLDPIILSVNGENHGAVQLYKTEGFQLTESVVAYKLDIV